MNALITHYPSDVDVQNAARELVKNANAQSSKMLQKGFVTADQVRALIARKTGRRVSGQHVTHEMQNAFLPGEVAGYYQVR